MSTTTSAAPAPWTLPPERDTSPLPVDPVAFAVAETYSSLIALGAATSPRNLQFAIGSSEIGYDCDRRLAYRLHGTPLVRRSLDPLRALVGIGVHEALAQIFRRLDAGSGRFLVEYHVDYRGVPGSVDLYDRYSRTVVDWKTSTKDKVREYRRDGLPRNYVVQPQMYGAGLEAEGEEPAQVAVVFLPYDGNLTQTWAWTSAYDVRVADDAVDRLERLRGRPPALTENKPSRYCRYCDHYRPSSTDLRVGCPGVVEGDSA